MPHRGILALLQSQQGSAMDGVGCVAAMMQCGAQGQGRGTTSPGCPAVKSPLPPRLQQSGVCSPSDTVPGTGGRELSPGCQCQLAILAEPALRHGARRAKAAVRRRPCTCFRS